MKHVKIKYPDNTTEWRLVIDNEQDLLKYYDIDCEQTMYAYLYSDENSDKHNPNNTRLSGVNRILEATKSSLLVGEKAYPIIEISKYLDRKIIGMLNAIKVTEICINSAGGYCYLNDFLKQHKAEIIETVIKNDCGTPNENSVIKSDLVILENDTNIPSLLINELKYKNIINDKTVYNTFTNLKTQDLSYVFKSIENCKTVALESQFMDINQVNEFINFFLLLDLNNKKTIIIKTNNKQTLIEHPDYNKLNDIHEIKFI